MTGEIMINRIYKLTVLILVMIVIFGCSIDNQREYLMLMSQRWSQENIEGFNILFPRIEKEYFGVEYSYHRINNFGNIRL